MRFLIDECVSLAVATRLRQIGHHVTAVHEAPTSGILDPSVYELARNLDAVLVSRDRTFTRMKRFPPTGTAGIIVVRAAKLTSAEETVLVENFVSGPLFAQCRGALVTIQRDRVRIRRPHA